jgi:hypothetical protein
MTLTKQAIIDSIEYELYDAKKLKTYVNRYIKNDYDLRILKQNWQQIRLLDNTSSSLASSVTRYGEIVGTRLFHEKNTKTTMTSADWIAKYGQEDAARRLSARGQSKTNYVNRHGDKLGSQMWKEYNETRAMTFAEGRAENRYASRDLEWFTDKYGTEKGYDVWDNKRKLRSEKISRNYLESIHGKEQADIILKKRHARDLNFYIRKYGEAHGLQRYKLAMYRMQKNRKSKTYSKWALACCVVIKEDIVDLFYFGDNELILGLTTQQTLLYGAKVVMPDLFYRGKIIEFNGDVFHGNPSLFEDNATPHPFNKNITALELQEKDEQRYRYYATKDYDVMVIWEHDYNNNKEKVIQQCLAFLK